MKLHLLNIRILLGVIYENKYLLPFKYPLRTVDFKSLGNQYLVAMVIDLISKRLSIKGIFAESFHH